jgi:hypothetical protein
MKKLIFFFIFCSSAAITFAQKETFDLATYTSLKGWKKQSSGNAVQFTKEDAATGAYCMITLSKAIPGTANAKDNFDAAWENVVKGMVKVTAPPTMQPGSSKDGWEAKIGYSSFDMEGNKGIALLVTSSGFEKMVNIIILYNSDLYAKTMDDFLGSVSFKKPAGTTAQINKPVTNPVKSEQTKTTAKSDGFAFTTTNFDDGWTSTVQEDWVQVIKGNITVLIHYPNKKADAYNSVVLEGLKNAWDILVAPRYSSASNFEFKPITGWQTIEFAEADLLEKGSNKKVHVVLFKMNYSNGSGRYLEFITPDKRAFEQVFGPYHQTTSGWENMEKMANYNKFAVAASDLAGKWTSDFSGAIQYVNAYTGFDAGMDTHASVENFNIGSGNNYNWDIGVASGQVGNIKFQSKKSSGRLTMTGNWKVNFSDIEGRPRSYDVYFSCIKGLRILWLDNKPFARAN